MADDGGRRGDADASVSDVADASGPDEDDERQRLTVELWIARDAVIGAETAAGQLRAKVRQLEAEVDAHQRHVHALVAEVVAMRERLKGLEEVERHRDAILRSPTWRMGTAVMRPLQALRRRVRP
jgi:hypothetical protein